MTVTAQMLESYPRSLDGINRTALQKCIDACVACAQACTACADACLSEGFVNGLRKCIRTDLDCADVCEATSRVLLRHIGYDARLTRAVLQACATVCHVCGDECASHADMHEHCRVCAEACRHCETACQELIAAL
jgi:hypothetical protein